MKTGPNIAIHYYSTGGRGFNFEHQAGSDKAAWIGAIHSDGNLFVHIVGKGEHTYKNWGPAPLTNKEAIQKILSIFKNKYNIELGKVIKFRDGMSAEQTVAPYSGKAWVIMSNGDTVAMYYPKTKHAEFSQTFFGDGSGNEMNISDIDNIKNLQQAVATVWLKIQQNESVDEIRKLVREVLTEEQPSTNNDIIEWIQEAPKEWYAVQKTADGIYGVDDAIGWIYKNLLVAVPEGFSGKWESIEPFYGEDFEKATEILLGYFREKHKVDIGKRYELPGGIYAIEWYNSSGSGTHYRIGFKLYMDDGKAIGTYYPTAKKVIFPMSKRPTQLMNEPAEDLNRAAYLAFMNTQKVLASKKR